MIKEIINKAERFLFGDSQERPPLPLPELNSKLNDPIGIKKILEEGHAIWGWYKLEHLRDNAPAISAMRYQSYGFDGLALFRKEGDYLTKYKMTPVGEEWTIYVELREVERFSLSNINNLFENEIKDAYKILLDKNEKITLQLPAFLHTLKVEDIEDHLKRHQSFFVKKEDFLLVKDYPGQ